jgi:hypothetical protein
VRYNYSYELVRISSARERAVCRAACRIAGVACPPSSGTILLALEVPRPAAPGTCLWLGLWRRSGASWCLIVGSDGVCWQRLRLRLRTRTRTQRQS